jgi:hypothetical protein
MVEFTPSFCLSQQSTERKREHSARSKKSFDPQTGQHDRISKAEAVLHLHRGTEVQNKDKKKMHHIQYWHKENHTENTSNEEYCIFIQKF